MTGAQFDKHKTFSACIWNNLEDGPLPPGTLSIIRELLVSLEILHLIPRRGVVLH